MKTNYLKLAALVLLALIAFQPGQAQQVGTPNGSTAFVNTGNAGFGQGGQLAHIQSGTFGNFGFGDQWIGIGNPIFGFPPSALPVYGFRIQEAAQSATMSLNDNTGGGSFAPPLDFELQWGPNTESKFRVNFINNISSPSAITNAMTIVPRGYVGIGQDNPSNGRLEVTNIGSSTPTYAAYFNNLNEGRRGSYSFGNSYGAYNVAGPVLSIGGVLTKGSFASYSYNTGGSGGAWFGAYGRAENSSFSNYGVYGRANGSGSAGIYGVYGSAPTAGVTNSFAGFFAGNLTYTGTFSHTSDRRLKKNIEGEGNVMDQIMSLRPSTYEYRNEGKLQEMNLADGLQHGFIAQELEEVFPELVEENMFVMGLDDMAEDENAQGDLEQFQFKSVNYTALIPILTKGMQEQQAEIEAQRELIAQQAAELASLKEQMSGIANSGKSAGSGFDAAANVLYQNTPNPFNQSTTIRYQVSGDNANAEILVFDMNGRQLKAYQNLDAGENAITIEGSDLEAGMYFYSLIVNGEEVATKRMILTK